MKNVAITYNGFHGHCTFTVRVPNDAQPGDEIAISARVAKRINNLLCGISDCQCGEGIAEEYNTRTGDAYFTLPLNGEIAGNYPQR